MQNHNLGIKRGIAQGSVYSGESNATLRLQTVVIRRNRPISISLIVMDNTLKISMGTGGVFSQQESHWCVTLCITNVRVDTAQ